MYTAPPPSPPPRRPIMYFEVVSPLRFYRAPNDGEPRSLQVYFGEDATRVDARPIYHRLGRTVDLRLFGYILCMTRTQQHNDGEHSDSEHSDSADTDTEQEDDLPPLPD